ncbi:hypothetical protein [Halomarina oriensis]|uniref:Uncharacterized protein n=1 Tax=Halomarina oriensis TaxID=671145 RepID=A0A6B0GUE2_9EURY|nr:hypothetical protein [Halomarina oriensis]MWG36213.1 hypothetical protein [Halomarina oriensis]
MPSTDALVSAGLCLIGVFIGVAGTLLDVPSVDTGIVVSLVCLLGLIISAQAAHKRAASGWLVLLVGATLFTVTGLSPLVAGVAVAIVSVIGLALVATEPTYTEAHVA